MNPSKRILLLYTSREGQTQKIMQHLADVLKSDVEVVLFQLKNEHELTDLSFYSAVFIGSSIRYGHYPKFLKQWIKRHSLALNQKLSAFIGVNLVARKENKNTPETNLYTKKFLAQLDWRPTLSAVFAGALYYPRYHFLDKTMIRFIMWLGKGETDVNKEIIEYTDWKKVDEFAVDLLSQIKTKPN